MPLFHELVRALRINPGNEPPLSVELSRELEDLRKFSLNLLTTFLTVHAVSAEHALAAITLALLVYTINLHVAVDTRFLRSGPTLSRFLHAIPLLGMSCMAIFQLVVAVRSPAAAAGVLLVCTLPLLVVIVHFVKRYTGAILMSVLVQTRDGTSAASGSAEA